MVNDLVTIEFTATEAGDQASRPWHCLYFFPLPQGQGSFRPTFGTLPGGIAVVHGQSVQRHTALSVLMDGTGGPCVNEPDDHDQQRATAECRHLPKRCHRRQRVHNDLPGGVARRQPGLFDHAIRAGGLSRHLSRSQYPARRWVCALSSRC